MFCSFAFLLDDNDTTTLWILTDYHEKPERTSVNHTLLNTLLCSCSFFSPLCVMFPGCWDGGMGTADSWSGREEKAERGGACSTVWEPLCHRLLFSSSSFVCVLCVFICAALSWQRASACSTSRDRALLFKQGLFSSQRLYPTYKRNCSSPSTYLCGVQSLRLFSVRSSV